MNSTPIDIEITNIFAGIMDKVVDVANDIFIFEKAGHSIVFNPMENMREYTDFIITQKDLKGGNPENPDIQIEGMIVEVLCTRNA